MYTEIVIYDNIFICMQIVSTKTIVLNENNLHEKVIQNLFQSNYETHKYLERKQVEENFSEIDRKKVENKKYNFK